MARETIFALAVALARFAFCWYRAAHQSITIDEAYTFNRYLRGSWWDIWNYYEANNHILFSILAKASIVVFGVGELALRLPSLIAGFFLTLGIYRVLRITVDSALMRWTALAALSLHPLLLDFSIAARGYGLSLAFLVWAIYFVLRSRYASSGVMLGLALSANLMMLIPAAGLLIAVALLSEKSQRERFRNAAVVLAISETIFAVLCFGALRHVERKQFYIGEPAFSEALRQLIYFSLRATDHSGIFGKDAAVRWIQFALLPAACLFVLIASRRIASKQRLIPVLMLLVCVAGMFAGHFLFNVNYPVDRMGLHLFLLFGIAWAIAADAAADFRAVNLAIAALLIAQFATQIQTRSFVVWREDMYDKMIARQIQALSAGRPARSVKVSTSWWHQPTIEFYRVTMNMKQVQPLGWNDPAIFEGYDFYVLGGSDIPRSADKRILFEDRDVVLAADW